MSSPKLKANNAAAGLLSSPRGQGIEGRCAELGRAAARTACAPWLLPPHQDGTTGGVAPSAIDQLLAVSRFGCASRMIERHRSMQGHSAPPLARPRARSGGNPTGRGSPGAAGAATLSGAGCLSPLPSLKSPGGMGGSAFGGSGGAARRKAGQQGDSGGALAHRVQALSCASRDRTPWHARTFGCANIALCRS